MPTFIALRPPGADGDTGELAKDAAITGGAKAGFALSPVGVCVEGGGDSGLRGLRRAVGTLTALLEGDIGVGVGLGVAQDLKVGSLRLNSGGTTGGFDGGLIFTTLFVGSFGGRGGSPERNVHGGYSLRGGLEKSGVLKTLPLTAGALMTYSDGIEGQEQRENTRWRDIR